METINHSFLNEWDNLIEWAVDNNETGYLYDVDNEGNTILLARTRHPSFMGVQPPKHDPDRDN